MSEPIVLRGTLPVARFAPVEPRPRKRLGILNEFMSAEHRHELRRAMETPASDAERRIVAGEGTDELGISARAAGFQTISPSERDWKEAAVRDWTHGDPFDRLLLAQAEGGGMTLLSKDVVFDEVSTVRV